MSLVSNVRSCSFSIWDDLVSAFCFEIKNCDFPFVIRCVILLYNIAYPYITAWCSSASLVQDDCLLIRFVYISNLITVSQILFLLLHLNLLLLTFSFVCHTVFLFDCSVNNRPPLL